MATYTAPSILKNANGIADSSLVHRFMVWTAAQEKNRFAWLSVIITLHGCVLAPVIGLAALATGLGFVYFSCVMGAMAMCLVSNLSAMPTKITIPIFFISLVIDFTVLIASVFAFIA